MICKSCNEEYNPNNFLKCPYCLSEPNLKGNDSECSNNDEQILGCGNTKQLCGTSEINIGDVQGLNNRSKNVLRRNNILTMKALIDYVESSELSGLRNVGVQTIDNITNVIKEYSNNSIYFGATEVKRSVGEKLNLRADIQELKELEVSRMPLSIRAKNALLHNGISNLKELLAFLQKDYLGNIKNIGAGTVKEIQDFLVVLSEPRAGNVSKTSIVEGKHFDSIHESNDHLPLRALKIFSVSDKAIIAMQRRGIDDLYELKKQPLTQLKEIISKRDFTKLNEAVNLLSLDIIKMFEEILSLSLQGREGVVFLRRAKGETLQEIADNPSLENGYSVTRERVRQIEKKYFKKMEPFSRVIFKKLRQGKRFIHGQDILNLYENDDYDYILMHIAKLFDEYEYLDFADVFVVKEDNLSEEKKLIYLAREFVGDGIDLYEHLEDLEELLIEHNAEYIGIGEFLNLLEKYGFRMYGDFVISGKPSYAIFCLNVIRKYFPDGIKLSQNNEEALEDLERLRMLVKQYYDYDLPENNRTLSARIADRAILCDRGKVTTECAIVIEDSLLQDIKEYIDSKPFDKIYYGELYSRFEGRLSMTSNISNRYFLHGVLKLHFSDEYLFAKDYLMKESCDITTKQESLSERIYKFIIEVGRPVNKRELKRKFSGISDIMLSLSITNCDKLFQWEYNYITCLELISYSESDIEILEKLLEKSLEKNMGYTSSMLFYEEIAMKFSDFLAKNEMKNEMNLFYFVSRIFDKRCDFRKPHITSKGAYTEISTKKVVYKLMNYPRELSHSEYIAISERMKWSNVTTQNVFTHIEEDYWRISQDLYLMKEEFSISIPKVEQISAIVESQMTDEILPLSVFDKFEDLPCIGYKWNEFLLETVVLHYLNEFQLVYPRIKDRRHQRAIVTKADSGLTSYDKVVSNSMKKKGIVSLTESQFQSFLIVHGLTRKTIPRELENSEAVKYVEGSYIAV